MLKIVAYLRPMFCCKIGEWISSLFINIFCFYYLCRSWLKLLIICQFFLEKPKDFYSIDNEQFKIKWEPTTDKKLLHDQIHPSEQKSFSLLYHWDFSKQDSQKAVTCQFFPTFDLSSLTSEENIFENVKPKIPQGLFPIFQINF